MATKKSFRKSQLIAFDNVAAGHDGVLSDPAGELVIKPCKQPEIDFYESTLAHPDFQAHIPNFYGKISLGADTNAAQAAGAFVLPAATAPEPSIIHGVPGPMVVENAWAPSNGGRIHTDSAVVLENVTAAFKKPNILDVKLGARLWDDDTPQAKRDTLDKVAEETTSKALGLRISGMRIYQGTSSDEVKSVTPDGYRFYDKWYGRTFSADTIAQGFEEYFQLMKGVRPEGDIREVIKMFVDDLRAIEGVMKRKESRMYSASLLFVYEGDQQALKDAFKMEEEIPPLLRRKSTDGHDEAISNDTVARGKDVTRGDNPANGSRTATNLKIDLFNGKEETEEEEEEEGDDDDDDDDDDDELEVNMPAIQKLKLIDFAHAEWTPGQGPDENVLHGIRNTTKILMGLAGLKD